MTSLLALPLLAAFCGGALGGVLPRAFPSAEEYYPPLIADPMELGYGGRIIYPAGGGRLGEVTIGDYVGIVRWKLGERWAAQANLGGGAIARFNLLTERNAMDVVDFTFSIPFDIAFDERHVWRNSYWHTSSHLGDDYIARMNPVLIKRALDAFKSMYSWKFNEHWRLYGGGSFAFNAINLRRRTALQAGLEFISPQVTEAGAGRLFLAQDMQWFQRVGWSPSYNIRGGIRFSQSQRIAAASLFAEYFHGRRYYLQFYEERETHWGFGIKFEIGNPTRL